MIKEREVIKSPPFLIRIVVRLLAVVECTVVPTDVLWNLASGVGLDESVRKREHIVIVVDVRALDSIVGVRVVPAIFPDSVHENVAIAK